MSKRLVAYFSASGVTGKAAQTLAEAAGAALLEGKMLNGRVSKDALTAWIDSLGL